MVEGAVRPQLDDFGITEEDLNRAPCLFIAGHRPSVIAAVYLTVSVVVFLLLLGVGGSPTAAAFFTVVSVAAGSILLLPILVVAVCASERVEERWLCGRFPKLSGCLAYRAAIAEFERLERAESADGPISTRWWVGASATAFVAAAEKELERLTGCAACTVDREATGFDFEVQSPDGAILVRCEPGAGPVPAAVGRELVAAVADRGAARAVVVTTAEASPALADYIGGRPIAVITPWRLEETIRKFGSSELGIRN